MKKEIKYFVVIVIILAVLAMTAKGLLQDSTLARETTPEQITVTTIWQESLPENENRNTGIAQAWYDYQTGWVTTINVVSLGIAFMPLIALVMLPAIIPYVRHRDRQPSGIRLFLFSIICVICGLSMVPIMAILLTVVWLPLSSVTLAIYSAMLLAGLCGCILADRIDPTWSVLS